MTESQSISMAGFQEKCKAMFTQKSLVDGIEEHRLEESKKLEAMKAEVTALMTDLGIKNFPVAGMGKLTVRKDIKVSMPKEPSDRDAFFGYLKEKGIFEELVSINHQTLNSYYKAEVESHAEEGDLSFRIPGIAEPKMHEYVVISK